MKHVRKFIDTITGSGTTTSAWYTYQTKHTINSSGNVYLQRTQRELRASERAALALDQNSIYNIHLFGEHKWSFDLYLARTMFE